VINASWGLDEFSMALSNTLGRLRDDGIIVVAAAGNTGRDIDVFPRYPACYDLDNIVVVGATTRRDELYPLTNFGATNVDVFAPGDEVLTTHSLADDTFTFDQGTSMAAAYVSGAAALLSALRPADPPADIIHRLMTSGDPLPELVGRCVSGGRLNLRKTLGAPISPPVLNAVLNASRGELVLMLFGEPGRSYELETSADLDEWIKVSELLAGLLGTVSITNQLPEGVLRQFYRARLAP
jgi:subtilisin family serine protease